MPSWLCAAKLGGWHKMVVMLRRDAFCRVLAKNSRKEQWNLRNFHTKLTEPNVDLRGQDVEIASLMPGLTSIMRVRQ